MSLAVDTAAARKDRGAFFTPIELASFMVDWAIRDAHDSVLEPSCGDAVFLREAARRLRELGAIERSRQLVGYDVHADSLRAAREHLRIEGESAELHHSDFFEIETARRFTVVVGNPPFIRFQGFGGRSRTLALAHARRIGVDLSALASSWAGFVLRASELLRAGGRLAFVLPSELLAVNYAAPIRNYLMKSFASIDVVVFDHLVFSGVQTDAVVLLADGFQQGPSGHITVHTAADPDSAALTDGLKWTPRAPSDKWSDALNGAIDHREVVERFDDMISPLGRWGTINSGIVTGANQFFAMNQHRAKELGLTDRELVRLLPRGLPLSSTITLTSSRWRSESLIRPSLLFAPGHHLSSAAKRYIEAGESARLHERYKTRIREEWWRVPLADPPDCFVTYMSASTPRIVSNRAAARNLNAVHGLRFAEHVPTEARIALPLLALSSVSLMSAELVGRSYGGGVLKMEPREAGRWLVPSVEVAIKLLRTNRADLSRAGKFVRSGDLTAATTLIDRILEAAAADPVGVRAATNWAIAIRSERLGRRLTRASGRRGGDRA